MNDLVEGCRIEGTVTLDGEDIFSRKMDVNLLQQARRHGLPEAESLPHEHL